MLARYKEKCPRGIILAAASTACLLLILHSNASPNTKPEIQQITSISKNWTSIQMVEYIKAHHLTPPSSKEYNLSAPGLHENPYSAMIHKILGNLTTGVFIEAGAFDGEDASNSLPLELLGWKGILVECNPQALPKLRSKNRKAWIADVCLSTTNKPGSVKLYSSPEWPQSAQINKQLSLAEMKIHGIDWMKNKKWTEYERPSFPLYSIIEAVGEFKQIDFLSLDVQGAEIDILQSFPFDKLPIKVIIAEVFTFNGTRREQLMELMDGKGYKLSGANGVDYTFTRI